MIKINKRKVSIIALTIILIASLNIVIIATVFNRNNAKITHNICDLYYIEKISKYRSCAGHEYPIDSNSVSSEKHYYVIRDEFAHDGVLNVMSYAIWDGDIVEINKEDVRGYQIILKADTSNPIEGLSTQFNAVYFHIQPLDNISKGMKVKAGTPLGYADIEFEDHQTGFDIAIHKGAPFQNNALSFFDESIITDGVFSEYRDKGANSTSDFIYEMQYRIENPCHCTDPVSDECVFDPQYENSSDWVFLNNYN